MSGLVYYLYIDKKIRRYKNEKDDVGKNNSKSLY